MVQLNYNQIIGQEIKHTIANSRGGRNLNLVVNMKAKMISYVVSEKRKIIIDTDDLQRAIDVFNELELTPAEPTKAPVK